MVSEEGTYRKREEGMVYVEHRKDTTNHTFIASKLPNIVQKNLNLTMNDYKFLLLKSIQYLISKGKLFHIYGVCFMIDLCLKIIEYV